MRGVLSSRQSREGFSRTAISISLAPNLLVAPPLTPPVTQILLKKWRALIGMSNTHLLRILALTKQLFHLRIACELFRHFHEFTHAKTARLPGRCLDKSDCNCILGQYILNASIAYYPHCQIWSVLTMMATAWVIWMYACASYLPWQMRKWVELWVYENHWRSINFIFKVLSGTASSLNFMDAGSPWYSKMNRWTIWN